MFKKNKPKETSEKEFIVTKNKSVIKELSDKELVLSLCKEAKLHVNKQKTKFVVFVNKKDIATGKDELSTWKRALRSLL